MNNKKGWNNSRRSKTYWMAILFLVLVIINIVDWFQIERMTLVGKLCDWLMYWYDHLMPIIARSYVQDVVLSLYTIVLICVVLIYGLNFLCGYLPNLQVAEKPGVYGYLSKSVMIVDICLGIFLEINAIHGLEDMIVNFRLASIALWIYIGFFGVGSYWYWRDILNIGSVIKNSKMLREKNSHEKTIWYCVSNCAERISSFTRVPWYRKTNTFLVDDKDLAYFKGAEKESFFNYLVMLDANKQLDSSVEENIRQIVCLPHSRILVAIIGGKEKFSSLTEFLVHMQNTIIIDNISVQDIGKVDIIRFIDEHKANVKGKQKRHPLRLSENETYKQTYLAIGKSPILCVSFLKMITSSLDVLPAIYALFDFIDLQYRLSIARIIDSQYSKQISWMRDKSRIIGNIGIMSRIIERDILIPNSDKQAKEFLYQDLFGEIITDQDMVLIKKYLSNYEKDLTKPVWATIVYLTYSLRNVLRGHGTFDRADAHDLYNLVFKLAILNVYVLDSNEIRLEVSDIALTESDEITYYYVYGQYKDENRKVMSPFLVSMDNGNILVFNNWNKSNLAKGKGSIEYINYLDGTLILPEYKQVEL